MEVHPFEAEFLKLTRKRFRYGEITLVMKDGLPFRILKRVESYLLTVDNVTEELLQ